MNLTANHSEAHREERGVRSSLAELSLEHQAALRCTPSRLAVWIILGAEFVFFATMIGALTNDRLGAESWPRPKDMQATGWHSAIMAGLLVGATATMFGSVRSIVLGGANSRLLAKFWIAGAALLGMACLVSAISAFNEKTDLGIYPQRGGLSLIHEQADLEFLAAVKNTCDHQILKIEKAKTGAASGKQELQFDSSRLATLRLVQKGLVRWTQEFMNQDAAERELALVALAHFIYPMQDAPVVVGFLRKELLSNVEELKRLQTRMDEARQNVNALQANIDQLTNRVRANSGDANVMRLLEQTTRSATEATVELSDVNNQFKSLEIQNEALVRFSEEPKGINRTNQLRLPMVIPGGTTWARYHRVLNGCLGVHVLACTMGCLAFLSINNVYLQFDALTSLAICWGVGAVIAGVMFFAFL